METLFLLNKHMENCIFLENIILPFFNVKQTEPCSENYQGYKCFHQSSRNIYIYIFQHVVFDENNFPFSEINEGNIFDSWITIPAASDSFLYSSSIGRKKKNWVETAGETVSGLFPMWVALGCLLGLLRPNSFNWVKPKWTVFGISVTMLGMGMTLTFDDLKSAFAMPKEVLTGFLLQYSVMPLSAYFVSKLLNLPSYYAAGLILVGCCPGGTASNIVTYIANGNVALSVLMTAASTLASVIMTPLLTAKLAGQFVAVDAIGLLVSTLQVVLLPVLAGAFLNQYFQGLVKFVSPVMPSIAVGVVAVLCGDAIAQSSAAILKSGQQVVLAAALLHAFGFFFGYAISRVIGIDESSSRTISIEVGMQNSVLGVVLATQHFGNPLTAVPCAVSSVCHSIFGSTLAGIWRRSALQQVRGSKVESISEK